MEELFLKLLNMSISASWLVLAVMLARLVLKKAPRGLICCLWALVAIRLVCPFSVESVLSLIPSAQTVPQEILLAPAPVIHSGVTFIDSAVNPVLSQSMAPETGASVNPMQIWTFLAGLVWLVGMGVMVIYALFTYCSIRIKVSACVEQDGVYICDYIDSPFILGSLRPRIYLPSALDGESRACVIAHEKAHLKRRDHWWKPLGFALLTIHWFNPLMWAAYCLLCRDIELACDERVVKDMGAEAKKAYSEALLRCSVPRRMIAACPLAFGEVGVKARVKSVLNYRKPAFWVILAGVLACVAVTVCFMTDPVEGTPEGTESTGTEEPGQRQLTLEDVLRLARKGEDLSWEDFEDYAYQDIGSGLFIYEYEIDERFSLAIGGGSLDSEPMYVHLSAGEDHIDIRTDDVDAFIEKHRERGAENGVSAQISHGYANMALALPEGWEYELQEYDPHAMCFGISFRPEGEMGWVRLQFWTEIFGVCGTGLEEKDVTLANGLRATQGYYDGSESWSFMVFDDLPGSYVVQREGVDGWWERQEDTVMSILGNAALAQGIIREDRAIELAREALNADIDYPVSWGTFDYTVGTWRVDFYLDKEARELGRSVTLDHLGDLMDDWGVRMSASDVTPGGMTLTVTQEGSIDVMPISSIYPGSMTLMTGRHYWLEVWNGTGWESVPLQKEAIFTTEGLVIPFGDSVSWKVSWEWLYGELPSGTYRMGKTITLMNPVDEDQDRTYYAVFQVNNGEEDAIRSTIRSFHESKTTRNTIPCESYVVLGKAVSTPLAGETAYEVVIYALVMRKEYTSGFEMRELGGSYLPTALTFRVEDGVYELMEYWTPKDGTQYEPSIREKFPADYAEMALNDQNYAEALEADCMEQARAWLDANGSVEQQIAAALEMLATEAEYASLKEYETLVDYGSDTLRYCFCAFQNGGQDDRLAQVMTKLCITIMERRSEEYASFELELYGQSWFRIFRQEAFALWSGLSDEEFEKHYPSAWLALASTNQELNANGELPAFSCEVSDGDNSAILTGTDAKWLYRLVRDSVNWEQDAKSGDAQRWVSLVFYTDTAPLSGRTGTSTNDYGWFSVCDDGTVAYNLSPQMSYLEYYQADPTLYTEVVELVGLTE